MRFRDRKDAGRQLAQILDRYHSNPQAIVIGLPRGGVVTAAEVANRLELPLDIMVPRKIGAPFNEELAVGAVTQDGDVIWNEHVLNAHQINQADVATTIERERKESLRRLQAYRQGKPPLNVKGKIVLIIDDGIATGATVRAAISSAKKQGASKIVVATPVAVSDTLDQIAHDVDEVYAVTLPEVFLGVGSFYDSFPQVTDEEVLMLLVH